MIFGSNSKVITPVNGFGKAIENTCIVAAISALLNKKTEPVPFCPVQFVKIVYFVS